MPLVDDGMTMEEAELLSTPAPKAKYEVEITGFKTSEDGDPIVLAEKSGNKMLVVNMKIATEGPQKGKPLKPYNAIFGTGFMANFKRAFPAACSSGPVDTDIAVGMRTFADVKITSYEGNDRNEIAKLYPPAKS